MDKEHLLFQPHKNHKRPLVCAHLLSYTVAAGQLLLLRYSAPTLVSLRGAPKN